MLDRLAFRPLLRVLCGAGRTGSWADLKLLLRQRFFPHRTAIAKVEGPSPPLLFQMASAYWVSQAIYVAAKLGIADLLKDGPMSYLELAEATASHPASLRR